MDYPEKSGGLESLSHEVEEMATQDPEKAGNAMEMVQEPWRGTWKRLQDARVIAGSSLP